MSNVHTASQIVEMTGYSKSEVHRCLATIPHDLIVDGVKLYRKNKWQMIIRPKKYTNCHTIVEIAEKYGISEERARSALRDCKRHKIVWAGRALHLYPIEDYKRFLITTDGTFVTVYEISLYYRICRDRVKKCLMRHFMTAPAPSREYSRKLVKRRGMVYKTEEMQAFLRVVCAKHIAKNEEFMRMHDLTIAEFHKVCDLAWLKRIRWREDLDEMQKAVETFKAERARNNV